jgi:hypothetical protein
MQHETSTSELYEFVMEKLPDVGIAKRARLCRTLATIIGEEILARDLVNQAEQLEEIEREHGQMLLSYRVSRKAKVA